MAIDFSSLLSAEQKEQLITQRLTQFAAEGYQHELNKQIAATIGDDAAIAQANAALATIETAINAYTAELDNLRPVAE